MEKIENLEEKKRLLNQTYYNDYLLNLEKKDNKFFTKIMKEYMIVKTDDGFHIVLSLGNPGIDKVLWFDDEQEIPKKSEELFINYNLQVNSGRLQDNAKERLFMYNPYKTATQDNLVITSSSDRAFRIDSGTYKRELTENEQNFIQEIYKILLDTYIERLKKYYKRYNDKIFVRGYWVNR